jgi:hypothetical protein
VQVGQPERVEPSTSAAYVSSVSVSVMSLKTPPGETRMPTRSAPIAAATAAATSTTSRARFSGEPPYASVRTLVPSARNWCSR